MKDSPIKLPEMNSNEFAQNKFYVFTTVIVKAITIQLKRLAFTGRNIDTNKVELKKKKIIEMQLSSMCWVLEEI